MCLLTTRGIIKEVGMLDSDDGYAREQAVLMLEESGVLDDYVERLGSTVKAERDRAVA